MSLIMFSNSIFMSISFIMLLVIPNVLRETTCFRSEGSKLSIVINLDDGFVSSSSLI